MTRITRGLKIAHLATLDDTEQGIIVDRDGSDESQITTHELADLFELPQLRRVIKTYTNPYRFIEQDWPTLVTDWFQTRTSMTAYCDETTLTELFVYWITHQFDELTTDQLNDLLFMHCLDRDQHEHWTDWSPYTKACAVATVFCQHGVPHSPEFATVLQLNASNQSIVYDLMRYHHHMADVDQLCVDVRQYLKQVLATSLSRNKRWLSTMYFSNQLEVMLEKPPKPVAMDDNPYRVMGGYCYHGNVAKLTDQLNDPMFFDEFVEEYLRVNQLMHKTVSGSVNPEAYMYETMTPVRLLRLSDTELLPAYLDAFDQVDRVGLLLPNSEMGTFSLNLLHWMLFRRRNQLPIPKPIPGVS